MYRNATQAELSSLKQSMDPLSSLRESQQQLNQKYSMYQSFHDMASTPLVMRSYEQVKKLSVPSVDAGAAMEKAKVVRESATDR